MQFSFPAFLQTGPDSSRSQLVWTIVISILVYGFLTAIFWTDFFQPVLTATDDYLRGYRTLMLLEGGAPPFWVEPRIGPPGGIDSHWSPLPNYLIYIMSLPFTLFLEEREAVFVASRIYPFIMTTGFVGSSLWLARGLIGRFHPGWILVALVLAPGSLHQFQPGRIDHHSLTIVMSVFAAAALIHAFVDTRRTWLASLAGGALGLGLASAAEIVPWLSLIAVMGGLVWLQEGGRAARVNLYLAVSTLVTAAGLFLVLFPVSLWNESTCDRVSPDILAFATAMAIFWSCVSLVQTRINLTWMLRIGTGLVLALPILGLTVYLFPHCISDPYGFEDPTFADSWLGQMKEAKSLIEHASGRPHFYLAMTLPIVLGLIAVLIGISRATERKSLLLAYSVIAFGTLVLVFDQIRFASTGYALLMPLMILLALQISEYGKRAIVWLAAMRPRNRMAIELAALMAIVSLIYVMLSSRDLEQESLLADFFCELKDVEVVLNGLDPDTIAGVPDHGFELLFRTDHRVLAGNHHRDEVGITLALDILFARDDAVARHLMEANEVGLILFCEPDLQWSSVEHENGLVLIERLFESEPPDWLERIDTPDGSGWFLYQRR